MNARTSGIRVLLVLAGVALAACGGDGGGTDSGGAADPGILDARDPGGAPDGADDPGERPDEGGVDAWPQDGLPVDPGDAPSDALVTDVAEDPGSSPACSPDGATRTAPCGGLNGRATVAQSCVLGVWTDAGECVDPDVCVDDETRIVPCADGSGGDETQACVAGQWIYQDDCGPAAPCADEDTRTVPCGLNGNGEQPQICVEAAWANDGTCDDPDVCRNGANDRPVPCGVNGIGQQAPLCVNGRWVAGPCATDFTGRTSWPRNIRTQGERPALNGILVANNGRAFVRVELDDRSIDVLVLDPGDTTARPMTPAFVQQGVWQRLVYPSIAGDRLFMIRNDGLHGEEAWLTDGTEAGTDFLGDLQPGRKGIYLESTSGGALSYHAGDTTWFSGYVDGEWRLFASDGGGTARELARVKAGGWDHAWFDGNLYFIGTTPDEGCTLWRSDGTTSGTSMFQDFRSSSTKDECPRSFTQLGDRLYFIADDTDDARVLWRTDGTPAGTVRVSGGALEPRLLSPLSLTPFNDILYFGALSMGSLGELWRTDGTVEGTRPLTDITGNPFVRDLHPLINHLYFTANSPAWGRELWRIPLTGDDPAAEVVLDIIPGETGSDPSMVIAVGGHLLFAADDATGSRRLYDTNAATGATVALGDGNPLLEGAVRALTNQGTGALAILHREDGDHLVRIGPLPNAVEIDVPMARLGGLKGEPAAVLPDGRLVFAGDGDADGTQPWVSDGTAKGTQQIAAVSDDPDGFDCRGGFHRVGDRVAFRIGQADTGVELWTTQGTPGSTALLKDLRPGADSSNPGTFAVIGDRLFFAATTEAGREPWASDLTADGTVMLGDIYPTSNSNPTEFVGIPGTSWKVLFPASDNDLGTELWALIDGSVGRVADLLPGRFSSAPRSLANAGRYVYFSADDGTRGRELWRTNGTEAGTAMMADAVAGAGGANPDWIVDCPTTGAADRVCYAGSGGKAGTGARELWASSGPGNDTALLADLNPKGGSDPAELFRNGDRLLLSAIYGATGRELVVVDLASGRATSVDIRPGAEGSNPHGFFAWDDRHTFFAANDGESGSELWVTDGTAAGTQQVADLNRGAGSSHPWVLARSGDKLFVQAWTAASGNELVVVELAAD